MFEEHIAKIPPLPPRRVSDLPGLRWTSISSRAGLLFMIALVIFFGLFPLTIFLSEPNARLAYGRTETAEGRVISVAATGCRGDGRSVTYVFTPPNAVEYHGTATLCSGSAYSTVEPGQPVPIKYLVADPSSSVIAGTDANEPPVALFVFFPLMMVLFIGPMFMPQVWEVFRARRIFSKGQVVQGKVVFVKRRTSSSLPGWPGISAADVFVSYRLASGIAAEAKAWCNNDWLLNQLVPGATVNIAVMDRKPSEAMLIEAFVR